MVTPVLNCAKYIEQTIRSVTSQGYPNLEYVIVDGGSTDGTVEIIRKYESHLAWWVSERDGGMYDALNKGFAQSSGEIMGWISGTDQLHVGSLLGVASVFRTFPEVEWITGRPTLFDEQGMTTVVGRLQRWSRIRFLAGANQSIQQESTFWRRRLWEKVGGYVDASRRMASDFELWVRFFRHARIYSINALIGGWRWHGDSLGVQELAECHDIQNQIIEAELDTLRWAGAIRAFRKVSSAFQRIPIVQYLWMQSMLRALYHLPGPDLPTVIASLPSAQWAMVRTVKDARVYPCGPSPLEALRTAVWELFIRRTFFLRKRLGLRREVVRKILKRTGTSLAEPIKRG